MPALYLTFGLSPAAAICAVKGGSYYIFSNQGTKWAHMTYIDLMLAWDMMAGLGGLKLKANQSFVQSQAIWLKWCGASVITYKVRLG